MKKLLTYILNKLIGEKKFKIAKKEEDGKIFYTITVPPDQIGLVIGKGGQTIKAIQSILRIKARLENKLVYLNIEPSTN